MIKARIGKENKICLVFDSAQTNVWIKNGIINQEGITHILRLFIEAGISFDWMSSVCLADVYGKPKAADYATQKDYVAELITTQNYNVLVPVGAEAFTRIVGFKGQQKYLNRSLLSEVFPGQKVIPLQNPLQAKYDPSVMDTIKETLQLIKEQCEFPELSAETRIPVTYTILDSIEKWDSFITYFLSDQVTEIAFDTETRTFDYIRGDLLTVQWSHKPGYSYLLPGRFYKDWTDAEWAHIVAGVQKLHADESKVLIGHNIKYDNLWLRHQMDVPFRRNNIFCTQVASFLCNENEPNDLKLNAIRNTDLGDYDFELDRFIDNYCGNKKNKTKKSDFTYEKIPFDILSKYALTDTDATIRLYHHYKAELKKEGQEPVHEMLMKFVYLFQVCESAGWPIDLEYCEQYLAELNRRIEDLEAELKATPQVQKAWDVKRANELIALNKKRKNQLTELKSDVEFKLGSTPNKKSLFFDVMGLPKIKKTKSEKGVKSTKGGSNGGTATDKEVLDIWIVQEPKHADFLLKYREWGNLSKIRSTYVMSFLYKSVEGRIHTTYGLTTTKTGRSASKNPNLQNIPAHSAEAKKVKRAVKAKEGNILIGADLQACEMRWCAVYAMDPKLIEIFSNGLDIHGAIAKELFPYIDCHINEVKHQYKFERNEISKRVQFGALYGMSAQAMTRNINASLVSQLRDGKLTLAQFKELCYTDEKSQKALDDYFIKYSSVNDFVHSTEEFTKQHGYSLSLFGRKRRVPAVYSDDGGVVAGALRQAVNATIQSVASDALLLSAYNLQCEIEDKNLPMALLGTIHDALYVECTEDFKQGAAEAILRHLKVMPVPNAPISMDAEAEWGISWDVFSEDFGAAVIEDDEEEDSEDDDQTEAP